LWRRKKLLSLRRSKAVKSEDGKYFDKEGNPTFNVAADGRSIGTPIPDTVLSLECQSAMA